MTSLHKLGVTVVAAAAFMAAAAPANAVTGPGPEECGAQVWINMPTIPQVGYDLPDAKECVAWALSQLRPR